MNISLICTVYNESESVRNLIESIIEQTRLPDEAVFVDGGSTDNTQEIIEDYAEENEWIKLYVDEGCNIAEGRNTAVRKAENDYIVGTDGGCILDENWVESMEKGFEECYEALSGLFRPMSSNLFEYVQGQIRCQHYEPEKVAENWPPSSRSVGFTREAWKDAGGYPEDLYTGEDSKFNSNIRRTGREWHVVRDAFVYWEMRPSWKEYYRQFYKYGQGDARAGNLFDYPGKFFGVSKVFWRLSSTWLSIIGLIAGLAYPPATLLFILGLAPQFGMKLPALKTSVNQKGLKAVPYWKGLILTATAGFFIGFHSEVLRKWLP
ncbi:glycosyltransferase [Candidatus Nanohalococcus occultus]|uniref:glycosyltransferase n=1 Tax=Candidatus Nanohalococcus occultus TaxID=2978047 RepID=UPI0039E083A2